MTRDKRKSRKNSFFPPILDKKQFSKLEFYQFISEINSVIRKSEKCNTFITEGLFLDNKKVYYENSLILSIDTIYCVGLNTKV